MPTLYERDRASVSALQKLRFFPLAVTGGKGSYLTGEDGRELLDLSASWGAASLGHAHPAIRAGVERALSDQAGASILSSVSETTVSLAERLLDLTPGDGERRVWIGHSGSDANETVARAVTAATGRPGIIAFSGAYHGGTAGSMAISGHSVQTHAKKSDDLTLIPYPDPYRMDDGGAAVLDDLKRRFASDIPPQQVAAMFIEPIQSDGGMIVPPPGFMRALASLCRDNGILVISDEVKVGLGRSGRLHCFEHEDFVPDIVTFGKGLGGGLPISAAVGPAAILDHATAFSMQTLHGNPVCAAAAHAVLDTIRDDDLAGNAARVGEHLLAGLTELQSRHEIIGDIRGRGLAIGVELVRSRSSREPADTETARLVYRAFELGLVIYYVGMQSNVLEFTPPLTLTTAEADAALAILDQCFGDLEAGRIPDDIASGFDGW